ncbi:MAG: hypothetical protein HF314_08875 [Ignavibacteria bacterium]|nr:hypothetical protein [Ignavibacteria bacterium]MCU7503174.1 hypothetical protein [Ignavibacteria bacterium]MCU7518052.1 hypothetical protein [Ignavibacteria bacterium]
MKAAATIFTLALMLSASLFAQSSPDSLSFNTSQWEKKLFSTKFDKLLSTYTLGSSLKFGGRFDKFFVGINESYNSTLIQTTPKNIKDEQYFSFITEYALNSFMSLGIMANNDILSDNRKIALNQASLLNGSFYTKFKPMERVFITPSLGYSNNNQIGQYDYGTIYGIEGLADNLALADMNISSLVKFQNEDISPRKNALRLFNASISNDLGGSFGNVLGASFYQNRKDFYFSADSISAAQFNIINNIQSRIESNYFVQDRFVYSKPSDDFSFDLTGRAIWRNVDRDTRYRVLSNVSPSLFDVRVEEFRLEVESNYMYHTTDFDGSFRVDYSERDEKHVVKKISETNVFLQEERIKSYEERVRLESQKNNIAEKISLSLNGNFRLSQSDFLSISLFHNKLRYDTPSEENFDDRDELMSIFRVLYIRKLSPFFDAFLNLEANLNHIVYIFAERSSNNNFTRLLKLSTGGDFKSQVINSKNTFEVSANYSVYDFEDIKSNFRSFSFRQMSMQDSTTIRLKKKLAFTVFGSLKFSEQGDFNWTRFTGKPVRNLEEIYFEPKLNYRLKELSLAMGIRYLTLKTFSFQDKIKKRESDYRSLGPVAEITLRLNSRLNLRIYGWYELIRADGLRRKLPNMNMQLNWEF